ncbi:MAG: hypothetical protein QOK21_4077 [Solirubrobacteraceae bacterium]|nr:hypothetical protein [Solirubrobacteraceae bacterium]
MGGSPTNWKRLTSKSSTAPAPTTSPAHAHACSTGLSRSIVRGRSRSCRASPRGRLDRAGPSPRRRRRPRRPSAHGLHRPRLRRRRKGPPQPTRSRSATCRRWLRRLGQRAAQARARSLGLPRSRRQHAHPADRPRQKHEPGYGSETLVLGWRERTPQFRGPPVVPARIAAPLCRSKRRVARCGKRTRPRRGSRRRARRRSSTSTAPRGPPRRLRRRFPRRRRRPARRAARRPPAR